jgi:menaquinone-specific isochorismate synthase
LAETNTLSIAENFSTLKYSLREKTRLAIDQKKIPDDGCVLRIEEPISDIDPLRWLHQQKYTTKTYWSERDHDFEMAGVGFTDVVSSKVAEPYEEAFVRMRSILNGENDGLRYYGGFRFDNDTEADSVWRNFGSYRFIIPQLEIVREGSNTKLALNMKCDRRSNSFDEIIEETVSKIEYDPNYKFEKHVEPKSRSDIPDKKNWLQNIENAMARFQRNELKKIVLARRAMFDFSTMANATHIMAQMKTVLANVFYFCFQPTREVAFVGASPELLYRREGTRIFSEAVAGTRPRGEDEATDEKLANELLNSPKDVREHDLVCQWIEEALMHLCDSFEFGERVQILRSSQVQHLYKRYRGVLNECDDAKIISMLYPTPAVAGTPWKTSLQGIRELEGFDRGWYAGPVGWIGSNSAEFAVGIRSGLIDQNRLYLFSGAGILPDSDAEKEWQELEHKISHFLKSLETNDN